MPPDVAKVDFTKFYHYISIEMFISPLISPKTLALFLFDCRHPEDLLVATGSTWSDSSKAKQPRTEHIDQYTFLNISICLHSIIKCIYCLYINVNKLNKYMIIIYDI